MRFLKKSWGAQSVALDFLPDLGDVWVVLAVSDFHDSNGLGEGKTRGR